PRGELKVQGAQLETDNEPHDQEKSQKHAPERRWFRSVDARDAALRLDTPRPKQAEDGPEGNRRAQGGERPNRLETSPRRTVQEEQHERGPEQSPLNLVPDEPLRPPVDPDPSWEWRRGSRRSRTRRCDERYSVVVFEPVTASQSFSRTASSLSASSWLRDATATSPRVFSIKLRATSCLRFRATKAVG